MRSHPWRTIAGLVMIFIPVALISGLIVHESSVSTQQNLDSARTSIRFVESADCRQDIHGSNFDCPGETVSGNEYDMLTEELPEFDIYLHVGQEVVAHHEDRTAAFNVDQVGYAPHAPLPSANEVLLPKSTMAVLDVEVGDTITVDGFGEWKIAGSSATYQAIVSSPTLIEPREFSTIASSPVQRYGSWIAVGSDEFTWENVLSLNKLGFIVASDDVIQNPSSTNEQYDEFAGENPPYGQQDALMGAYILAMIFVGFVFLLLFIMPVFALSAVRQARNYAVMRSQGASQRHIRLTVMAYGFVTGLIGATLGLATGAVAGAILYSTRYPGWPLDFGWGQLAAAWLGAVTGSTIAAFIPAWITARQSIASGVQGAAPDKMMRFSRWFLAGPVGIVAGAVLLAVPFGQFWWENLLRPFGWPILILGVAGCAPLLVYQGTRWGSSLPLVGRLAMRDVSRQALRSVPAIAVILAVTTISVLAYSTSLATMKAEATWTHKTYNPAAMYVSPSYYGGKMDPEALDTIVAEVESIVGPVETYTVEGNADAYAHTDSGQCNYTAQYAGGFEVQKAADSHGNDPKTDPQAARACLGTLRSIPISSPWVGGVTVASEATLKAYEFSDPADYQRAMGALDEPAVLSATGSTIVDIVSLDIEDFSGAQDVANPTGDVKAVPALPEAEFYQLITASALDKLNTGYYPVGAIFVAKQPLTAAQSHQLSAISNDSTMAYSVRPLVSFEAERYISWLVAGGLSALIVVVIALIMSLSTQGTNRHFALLTAVGAAPTLPRRVSGMYAAILAFVGTLFGTTGGLIASWASTISTKYDINGEVLSVGTRDYLAVDWLLLLTLLVVVPLLSYGIGTLVHREPQPNAYRET
ncbi:hypothetical protein QP027_03020 [Corynebacterium breve]|uniref:ABC3 transporter permease C-terminal domain-containing protein n=1 Tax=Corynebacterium breve TaxID=3049799 RepID=A0ABY8VFW3_9CORY|nr:FtsX-like permease family protein [Corynebacterium breve]WIM68383.1 hypothetical protein QP027_03020 [Corynebacterium breve]